MLDELSSQYGVGPLFDYNCITKRINLYMVFNVQVTRDQVKYIPIILECFDPTRLK